VTLKSSISVLRRESLCSACWRRDCSLARRAAVSLLLVEEGDGLRGPPVRRVGKRDLGAVVSVSEEERRREGSEEDVRAWVFVLELLDLSWRSSSS